MPTVVQVTDFGPLLPGNFVSSILALQEPLAEAGLRQVLVLPPRAKDRPWARALQDQNVLPIYFLTPGKQWSMAREVAEIVRREDGRIMHAHFSPSDNVSWPAQARLKWRHPLAPRCRLVWHYHRAAPLGGLHALISPLKYRLMGRSAYHLAVSQGVLDMLLARGVPTRRSRVVLNAVDLARATRTTSSRDETRAALGVDPDHKVLLLFGHDPHRKGVDTAIAAVKQISADQPGIVLVLIGRDKMREYVRQQLADASIPWLRMAEPQENVANYYAAADVFLSPSRSEGLPYAVLEALANRLPVVSCDIPGMEWAHGLSPVRLCPPGDAAGLAGQIAAALQEPDAQRRAAAQEGSDYVRSQHSLEQWARQIVSIYTELLHTGRLAQA